jgi:hypothetical protein
MSEDDVMYEEDKPEEAKEGRYYLGDGLWTHPETGGEFMYSNPADNR